MTKQPPLTRRRPPPRGLGSHTQDSDHSAQTPGVKGAPTSSVFLLPTHTPTLFSPPLGGHTCPREPRTHTPGASSGCSGSLEISFPQLGQAKVPESRCTASPFPHPLPRVLTPTATSQTRARTPIPTRAHRASPGLWHQSRAEPDQPSPAALAIRCPCRRVPRTPSAWNSQICGLGPLTARQPLALAPT